MLCYKSPALSILLALLGVLHTALASPPLWPRFETNYTALSLKNASTYKKSRENGTSTVTSGAAGKSISCQNPDPHYWAPTVENWKEEDVDAKLSSWALNLVQHPPTAIPKGSHPTQLPRMYTGFGNTTEYKKVIGIPGQLMALASSGKDASCEMVKEANGQCGTVTVDMACGNMPRWAYLAWLAIYNMYSIHLQINAIILYSTAYQLGQAREIVRIFAHEDQTPNGLEILLTILGAVITIIGILIPLSSVGAAAVLRLENTALANAAAKGGVGSQIGLNAGRGSGSAGGGSDAGSAGGGSDAGSAGGRIANPSDDPDAIHPISPSQPSVNTGKTTPDGISTEPIPPKGDDGTTPVVAKPPGDHAKANDPAFLGNTLLVAPGIMTSMANSIWQESQKQKDPSAKADLNGQAVVNYLTNQSAVLTQYNDALFVNTDNESIHNLLSVLAGGSFIDTAWSQAIFEIALSADVVSRQINTAWTNPSIGGTYVSYTQLHDDESGSICNGTHVGVRSTRVCADTGVYYLNNLNFPSLNPALQGPPGFNQLVDYGIMPWWPVRTSAIAYRLMNPDGNVVPPQFTTTNDSIFANYVNDFASSSPSDLLSTVGQLPGTWTFPVCDQGGNFWGLDWSNTGGYTNDNVYYQPYPCACGYQGSGTKAFYEALGIFRGTLVEIAAGCNVTLRSVDPNLELKPENTGWNQISGGPPPSKSIDYGYGNKATVPTGKTELCYMGADGCGGPGDSVSSDLTCCN